MSPIRPLTALVLVLAAWSPYAGPAHRAPSRPLQADTDAPGTEVCFAQQTNATRVAQGRPPLTLSSQLSDEARAHSQQMAATNNLYHSTIRQQYGSQWKLIGENVGTDNRCDIVQQAFLVSPHHFENIINPVWTMFGVGVVYDPNGTVWVTVAFVEGNAAAPPPRPAPAPAPTKAVPPPAPRPAPPPVRPAPVVPPTRAAPAPPPPAPTAVPTTAVPPAPPSPTVVPSASARVLPLAAEAAALRKEQSSNFPTIFGLVLAVALGVGAASAWALREKTRR